MSIRIALTDQPEFYTNLDVVAGRVVMALARPEQIGAIIVKLEGESRTALATPSGGTDDMSSPDRRASDPYQRGGRYAAGGNILHENHKILYKVAQAFPDPSIPASAVPVVLQAGQYEFPFSFKMPFNNACSDPAAMAKIGGFAGAGGFGTGPGLFGMGGIRVMDGSRQLLYHHVTKTLPPSFTGFPRQAEIRYFVKVTIQRPGLFKENWRYQTGLKFLPIEPIRPESTGQEAFARRPFTFQPKSPAAPDGGGGGGKTKKGSSSLFFSSLTSSRGSASQQQQQPPPSSSSSASSGPALQSGLPPSVEMSARLPHPTIITCNQPIPLRLIAKKLAPSRELTYLTSLQIELVGSTHVRSQQLVNTETSRWVVVSRTGLSIQLTEPDTPVGTEVVLPTDLWNSVPLPNTVMPSFVTCNLGRDYSLELKLAVSWGRPSPSSRGKSSSSKNSPAPTTTPTIFLPLHFSSVQVFSGMAPPPSLVKAMSTVRRPNQQGRRTSHPPPARPQSMHATPSGGGGSTAPMLPPRPVRTSTDALYPPQLPPGGGAGDAGPPGYDDAPPSYSEAMAEEMTGPMFPPGQARPAYSGVTNENAPESLSEKN